MTTREGAVLRTAGQVDALPIGTQARAGHHNWLHTMHHGWVTPTDLGNITVDAEGLLQFGPATITRIPNHAKEETS